jgi:hypothetical protein
MRVAAAGTVVAAQQAPSLDALLRLVTARSKLSNEQREVRKRIGAALQELVATQRGVGVQEQEELVWESCFHQLVQYVERKVDQASAREGALRVCLDVEIVAGLDLYERLFAAARDSVPFQGVCRVRKGDLLRYRFHSDRSLDTHATARDAYLEAIALDSQSGHAHNQLGVLAITGPAAVADPLEAMFRFLCATKAAAPFEVAAKNLEDTVTKFRHLLLDGEPVRCVRRVCLLAHLRDEAGLLKHVNFCLLSPEPRHLPSILVGLLVSCFHGWAAGLELEAVAELLNGLREEAGPDAILGAPLEELETARACGLTFVDPCAASAGARVLDQLRVRRLAQAGQALAEHEVGLEYVSASGLFRVRAGSNVKRLRTASVQSWRAAQSRIS